MPSIGSTLTVDTPTLGLFPGVRYFLLRSQRQQNRVLLVFYAKRKNHEVRLLKLRRDQFEEALLRSEIIEHAQQHTLPPYLERHEQINLEWADSELNVNGFSHRQLIDERISKIAPLLERCEEILLAENPERMINQWAHPKGLNTKRIRLWFFTYLVFNRNKWSLVSPLINNGYYDRDELEPGPRSGAGSIVPEFMRLSRLSEAMNKAMVRGYARHQRPGKSMVAIYTDFLTYDLKCETVQQEDGRSVLVPTLKDEMAIIPTLDQFRYRIHKEYKISEIRRNKYGELRYRRKYAAIKGPFSQDLTDIGQRVEQDVQYSKLRPIGLLNPVPLPPLVIARSVDGLTGFRLGLGFDFEKERNVAYLSALFCIAIDKVEFCSLFGYPIEPDDWPSVGLPATIITDRGPGMSPGLTLGDLQADGIVGPVIREVTRSGAAQDKATVETANRKQVKFDGPGTIAVGTQSPFVMIHAEIEHLIYENRTLDVSKRMTPEMLATGVENSPNALYLWNKKRARTAEQLISYADAVRHFLKRVEVKLMRDGAYLRYQRYTSDMLVETGVLERIADLGVMTVTGYVLSACVRYIWVEIEGEVIKVEAQLQTRDHEEQLFQSYDELLEADNVARITKARGKSHKHAAKVESNRRFKEATGKKLEDKSTRIRPAKAKTTVAREEAKLLAQRPGA